VYQVKNRQNVYSLIDGATHRIIDRSEGKPFLNVPMRDARDRV
jgi:hypothetical protein